MSFITILHKDKKGLVADISELLERQGINIDKIHAVVKEKTAEIILVTEQIDKALKALVDNGYTAISSENILVRVKDRPGALAAISRRLSDSNIDIRGITMVNCDIQENIIAISTDQDDKARTLLKDLLIS
jgi:hypothetical protein